MYTDIEKELDELVAKDLVSEWRWELNEIYVFVDDNMWEDFKKDTKDLFILDDNGLKAIIQRDYIFLDLDPEEDFNL